MSDAESVAPTRATLGRYALRYRVAQGGMASVFLAQLTSAEGFRKWAAVKVVHPHIASDRRFIEMFLNEARLAARIDHPNVCTVFDFGEAAGTYYIAMEYLHGESLQTLAKHAWRDPEGLSPQLCARLIADAARGLHAAHELRRADGELAEVVHRDISPQNIFVLYTGVSKVVDFGVARSSENIGEGTMAGELKGKLAYMAPEQTKREPLDRRADLWALGVVLWEITLGRRLFRRESEAATLMAVIHDDIPRPSAVRDDYPPELERIVMRLLERDVSKRYATAQALARDLEAFITSTGVTVTAEEVGERMRGLFGDKIAQREDLLRRAPPEGAIESVVEGTGPTASVLDPPTVAEVPAAGLPTRAAPAPMSASAGALRGALGAAALLVLGALAFFAWQAAGPVSIEQPVVAAPNPDAGASTVVQREPDLGPRLAALELDAGALAVADLDAGALVVADLDSGPLVLAARDVPAREGHRSRGDRHARHDTQREAPTPPPNDPPLPTAPSGARQGKLTVVGARGSIVTEGSRRLGSTPIVETPIPAGMHNLRITGPDGQVTHEIRVFVQANATAFVSLD